MLNFKEIDECNSRLNLFGWSNIRIIGCIRILKIVYLLAFVTPFIPKYIDKLEKLGVDLSRNVQEPLLIVFVWSMAFGLALYELFCPEEIRMYHSLTNYYLKNYEKYYLIFETNQYLAKRDSIELVDNYKRIDGKYKLIRFICSALIIIGLISLLLLMLFQLSPLGKYQEV